jgi:hypothetical protein
MSLGRVTKYDVQVMKYIHSHWDLSIGCIADMMDKSREYVSRLINDSYKIKSDLRHTKSTIKEKKQDLRFIDKKSEIKSKIESESRPSTKPMVKPKVKEEIMVDEWDLFQRIYNDMLRVHEGFISMDNLLSFMFNRISKEYYKELRKLPRYKGKLKVDTIRDVLDILDRNFKNENPEIDFG